MLRVKPVLRVVAMSTVAVATVAAFAGLAPVATVIRGDDLDGRVVVGAGAEPQAVEQACTAAQKDHRQATLAAYRKGMDAQRRAYFRTHRRLKLRRSFVQRQHARLKQLERAAACTVSGQLVAAPPLRFIFHSGSDQVRAAALGFNLLDVDSKSLADALPAGTRGSYWLGDYINAPTCDWEKSDATIAAKVRAGIGDRKIWGYYFSNEPDPYGCPNAVAQHRARAALIRSIDPTKSTFISLDMNWREQALRQIPRWVGVADYVGLNPYVCFVGQPTCDYPWIDKVISAANAAGLVYFGHVQAFQADEWRWPTPNELRHMLKQWAASKQKGYSVFTWSWGGSVLASRPTLMGVLKQFNTVAARTRPTLVDQ